MKPAFFFKPHQHKGKAFLEALMAASYKKTRIVAKADFVLLDFLYSGLFSGVHGSGRLRREAALAIELGKPIFLYPHWCSPWLPHDLEVDPVACAAFFVHSAGYAKVLEMIGYPTPTEVVGWSYTDVRPFSPFAGEKPRVLFAPLHPVGGTLPQVERDINEHTFRTLVSLRQAGELASLTVRFYGDMGTNGIQRHQEVHYRQALLSGTTKDMDEADVVVSSGTYAHMAVALGKPTVMMGQDIRPHNSPRGGGQLAWVRNWELYRDFTRYPHSIEMGTSPSVAAATIRRACETNAAVEEWKASHIGEPFDPAYFVQRLESYL
ncbi:MAG: hypothetical protein KF698_08355 [Anaerolineales bacterium]|nr:hypothetical protein [Anaerolineales bacterium]